MPILIGLSYSPWTHKARWALAHHHVPIRYFEYTPLAGEPLLRLAARRLRGRVSVPVVLDGRRVVEDSLRIARYAESIGGGAPLFPPDLAPDIERWNEVSERLLEAGRGAVTIRLATDPDALAEAVPAPLRGLLGPLAVPVARLGNRFVQGKYRVGPARLDALGDEMRRCLDVLRAGLAGGRTTLLDAGFTYADVAMAVTLQLLEPADALAHLGPATRGVWADPALARDYADLLAWRARLLRDHPAD